MFEHPEIEVCHLYEVPRSVARMLCRQADLAYWFSSLGAELVSTRKLKALSDTLGLPLMLEGLDGAEHQQLALVRRVVTEVAGKGTHLVLMVQLFNRVDVGCVCMMPREHFKNLGLRRPEHPP